MAAGVWCWIVGEFIVDGRDVTHHVTWFHDGIVVGTWECTGYREERAISGKSVWFLEGVAGDGGGSGGDVMVYVPKEDSVVVTSVSVGVADEGGL